MNAAGLSSREVPAHEPARQTQPVWWMAGRVRMFPVAGVIAISDAGVSSVCRGIWHSPEARPVADADPAFVPAALAGRVHCPSRLQRARVLVGSPEWTASGSR